MKKQTVTAVLALCGLMLAQLPMGASFAQSAREKARQRDKNNMRNLGTGLGALAVHKSLKGDPKTAIVLGAGALYAGKKYEDQRKAQKYHRSYRYRNGRKVGYYLMRGRSRVRYVNYGHTK